MKVVLFCGGQGLRMRDFSESIPKPMVPIGSRPIMWNVMKYYAHYGHTEFILCLGWQGNQVKEYFLNYDECMSNDFVLSQGGRQVQLLNRDIEDWSITFVDTGITSNVGQRLLAVEPYLEGEETFLANYTDGLSDLPLPEIIDCHHRHEAIATFVSVPPRQTFHVADIRQDGIVNSFTAIGDCGVWINGGYFVFNRRIFDFIQPGEDLVEAPFHRLIHEGKLCSFKYEGFWGCMDTFKEKQLLDDMTARGEKPWEVWNRPAPLPVLSNLEGAAGHHKAAS